MAVTVITAADLATQSPLLADDGPQVVFLRGLTFDPVDGEPKQEGIFSGYNDATVIQMTAPALVGSTDPGLGHAQNIYVEPPLGLSNQILSIDLSAPLARIGALETRVTADETTLAGVPAQVATLNASLAAALLRISTLEGEVAANQTAIASLTTSINALWAITSIGHGAPALATGAVGLTAPTLHERFTLLAAELDSGAAGMAAPVLGTVLTAAALATGAVGLGSAYVFTKMLGASIATGGVGLGAPALTVGIVMTAPALASGAVWFAPIALATKQVLTGMALATGADSLGSPVYAKVMPPAAALATGADSLGAPSMTQVQVMASAALATGADALGPAVLSLRIALPAAAALHTGADALGSQTLVIATYSTWSTTDKTNTTLSSGNRTASIAGGIPGGVRGTLSHSSGKWYFEVAVASGAYNNAVGVADAAGSLLSPGYSDADGGFIASGTAVSGAIEANTGATSVTTIPWQSATIGVAVDVPNHLIYFSVNGVWQNSASPGGGVGGVDYITTAAVFPWYGNSGTASATGVLNVGNATFANAPPSGFTAWG